MTAVAPSEIRDERLLAIARIALDVAASEIADDARAAATRLDEGLFYVAVLGQFKRGKSTLINALAGHELLPTGVAPVTSVVTVVRHGTRRTAAERMIESRRGIEAALRKHLNATATAAREAASRARSLQEAGARAVEDELQRLARLRTQLGEA